MAATSSTTADTPVRQRQKYDGSHMAQFTPEQREQKKIFAAAYYKANRATIRERQRLWRAANADYFRQHRYGLTPDDYDNLLVAQNNACALCKRADKKLHVDHCHSSGRVRGLLCMTCNTALGKLGDSLETLNRAIDYLKAPQQQS